MRVVAVGQKRPMKDFTKPCAPKKATEESPRLRELLRRCWRCGGYLECEECLDAMVRLTHWLDSASPTLAERIRGRLKANAQIERHKDT